VVEGCVHTKHLCCHIFYTVLPVQQQQSTIRPRPFGMFSSCNRLALHQVQIPVAEMDQALEAQNSMPEVDFMPITMYCRVCKIFIIFC
jgi:hypothetical protein